MLYNPGTVANSSQNWSFGPALPESVLEVAANGDTTQSTGSESQDTSTGQSVQDSTSLLSKSDAETANLKHSSPTTNDSGGVIAVQGGLGSVNRWSHSSSPSPPQCTDYRRGSSLVKPNSDGRNYSKKLARPASDVDSQSRSSVDISFSAESQPGHMHFALPSQSNSFEGPKKRPGVEGENSQLAVDRTTNHLPHIQNRAVNKGYHPIREESRSFSDTEDIHEKQQQGLSQKVMLSRALQKANTAVLLDNAANFEGAIDAYNDACQLLQLVMLRSSGGDDEKLRLQEIRDTYTVRVTELQRLDNSSQQSDEKALPPRPLSGESFNDLLQDEAESPFLGQSASSHNDDVLGKSEFSERKALAPEKLPPRRQSLLPSALDDELAVMTPSLKLEEHHGNLKPTQEMGDLSLHALSPQKQRSSKMLNTKTNYYRHSPTSFWSLITRDVNDESTSWLDTINESGPPSPSSTHSKVSTLYQHGRRGRSPSCGTEAEFDAALDAAVEAAYNEGLEPEAATYNNAGDYDSVVAKTRKNVELAKQKVRDTEQKTDITMIMNQQVPQIQEQAIHESSSDPQSECLGGEAKEEERLLDEISKDYAGSDLEIGVAHPRQKDPSGFSNGNWKISVGQSTIPTGEALPTLAEDAVPPSVEPKLEPSASRPSISASSVSGPSSDSPSLSQPLSYLRPPSAINHASGQGVRARRLSGQNAKELKIETSAHIDVSPDTSKLEPLSVPLGSRPLPPSKDEPQTGMSVLPNKHLVSVSPLSSPSAHSNNRNDSADSLVENASASVDITKALTQDNDNPGLSDIPLSARPISNAPWVPSSLDKNNSNLKTLRTRNVSMSTPDRFNYPGTPSSNAFPNLDLYKGVVNGTVPVLPTPSTGANLTSNGLPTGGLYLFDNSIHSPTSPGCPNPTVTDAPVPLEPCPESFLLRPFWLLRCIYQTIVHPRGGYLSTKLFVPRDAWRVKNVKIKAVEDKVSNCDMLTAALLKLAQVDTYDADAVLDEMQTLEGVFDQVQASLSKKLGNEVGVQGAMPLFKPIPVSDDTTSTSDTLPAKTSSGPSRSYLSSWRKLRSKNSGFGTTVPASSGKESGKDHLTISSLPMTPTPSSRSQSSKHTVSQLRFDGPNATYMEALARLCDAAQLIDQIARQVEDPGLRHSSQTLVGLELSTRHAAEFFGFYMCRFALNDIGMLLDKFIKRGSEWVLV